MEVENINDWVSLWIEQSERGQQSLVLLFRIVQMRYHTPFPLSHGTDPHLVSL